MFVNALQELFSTLSQAFVQVVIFHVKTVLVQQQIVQHVITLGYYPMLQELGNVSVWLDITMQEQLYACNALHHAEHAQELLHFVYPVSHKI